MVTDAAAFVNLTPGSLIRAAKSRSDLDSNRKGEAYPNHWLVASEGGED